MGVGGDVRFFVVHAAISQQRLRRMSALDPKQKLVRPLTLSARRQLPAVRDAVTRVESDHLYGYCFGFRRDRPRRLLKRGASVGAVDDFGNCARKRLAMSPTGPSKAIADSITAAATRR